MKNYFDIFCDLTTQLKSADTELDITIPYTYTMYNWEGFCTECTALFRYTHNSGSQLTAASYDTIKTTSLTSRDPMIAMIPFSALRIRVDKPTNVYNKFGLSENILVTSYGEAMINTLDRSQCQAKYSIKDNVNPILMKLNKQTGFKIQIDTTPYLNSVLKYNTQNGFFKSTNNLTEWDPVYFIIKFRFVLKE